MSEKRYCPACGAELDAEGICTREGCMRRKIQMRKKAADEAVQKQEKARLK